MYAVQVFNSSRDELPPSSLLAWRSVLPDVGAVYLGDFNEQFSEDSYWSYKDLGLRQWSRDSVARSAILLARTLHLLASGSQLDDISIQVCCAYWPAAAALSTGPHPSTRTCWSVGRIGRVKLMQVCATWTRAAQPVAPQQKGASTHLLAGATLHKSSSDCMSRSDRLPCVQRVTELTDELFECLAKPHGLRCELVQSMTGTHTFSSAERNTAEQYVGVLRERPVDDQSRGATHKKNIERFVWEFLANRTYTGTPHDVPDKDGAPVGCDENINTCPEQEVRLPFVPRARAFLVRRGLVPCERCLWVQVCLHVSGGNGEQGQCVRADVKYTPAYPTNLDFEPCDKEADPECLGVWVLADADGTDRDAPAWARSHGLPDDPMWTETFNEIVGVTVNLRERPLHDAILLVCGVLSTGLVAAAVIGIKALHKRQKLD